MLQSCYFLSSHDKSPQCYLWSHRMRKGLQRTSCAVYFFLPLIFATLLTLNADPTSNCAINDGHHREIIVELTGRIYPHHPHRFMFHRMERNDKELQVFRHSCLTSSGRGLCPFNLCVNLSKLSQFISCTLPLLCNNRMFAEACTHQFSFKDYIF